MGRKGESVGNVGCKVLYKCGDGMMPTGSNGGGDSRDSFEKVGQGGERRRAAVSRMKELLRWAAAVKAHKGGSKGWKVLYFRHRFALKDPIDDASSTSSRISFKWDVGSCSTSSSVYSPLSVAPVSRNDTAWAKNLYDPAINVQIDSETKANTACSLKAEDCIRTTQWITTDADFVVLEL